MNAFEQGRSVEIRGLNDLVPFIRDRAYEGRFVLTDKGAIAEFLQKTVGDALMNCASGKVWGLEIKTEESDKYGTFFLEVWSNRCFGRRTVGWMITLQTDLLLYYFLEQGDLYVIDFRRLWNWLWGQGQKHWVIQYPIKAQTKYAQLNETAGFSVPIADVRRQVGFKKFVLDRAAGKFFAEGERVSAEASPKPKWLF